METKNDTLKQSKSGHSSKLNIYLAMSLGLHFIAVLFLISPGFRHLLGVNIEKRTPVLAKTINVELIDVTMENVAFNPKDLEQVTQKTKKSVTEVVKKTFKTSIDSQSNKLKIEGEVTDETPSKTTAKGVDGGESVTESRRVLMSYKDYLTNYLNSSKQYPRIAEKLRQEGMVVLELVINKQGLITNLNIKQSSNFKILDTAALNLVKSLSPFKELPRSHDKDYTVEVPIVYQIN